MTPQSQSDIRKLSLSILTRNYPPDTTPQMLAATKDSNRPLLFLAASRLYLPPNTTVADLQNCRNPNKDKSAWDTLLSSAYSLPKEAIAYLDPALFANHLAEANNIANEAQRRGAEPAAADLWKFRANNHGHPQQQLREQIYHGIQTGNYPPGITAQHLTQFTDEYCSIAKAAETGHYPPNTTLADLTTPDPKTGRTPFHVAAQFGHYLPGTTQEDLQAYPDNCGNTPLLTAIQFHTVPNYVDPQFLADHTFQDTTLLHIATAHASLPPTTTAEILHETRNTRHQSAFAEIYSQTTSQAANYVAHTPPAIFKGHAELATQIAENAMKHGTTMVQTANWLAHAISATLTANIYENNATYVRA